MTALLLEEDEEDEKEDPEQAHGMPVPGGAVDGDLAHLDALEAEHGDEGKDEGTDAQQQVDAVGSGDQIEEVAVGIGGEEESLLGELLPGDPLADEEEAAEDDGGDEPGCGAADGGAAEAEPLFHDVDFAEEMAAAHLHGEGGEQEDGGVDPEDRGRREKMPVGDDVVGGIDVDGALADEESADENGEEDEVAGETGEHSHAIADELLARTVTAGVA